MFRVRLVRPEELASIQRLRAVVYETEGLEDPAYFTADGRYVDANDAWSFNMGAFPIDPITGAEGSVAGCFKVTPRFADRPLKLEADVPAELLTINPETRCVEMARLAVLPEFRRSGVALGLWQAAYWVAAQGGFETIYAFQREGPLRTQEKMGLPVERLNGQIIGQNDLLLTPTRIEVAQVLPALVAINPAMAYFFSQPLPNGFFDPRAVLRPPADQVRQFVALQAAGSPTAAFTHAA